MAHIHELYDFVVTIYIVHEGRVLLVYHPRYEKWLPIGGHIELNEDPEMALWREIKEESGYDADKVEILSTKPEVSAPGFKMLLTPNFVDVHEANPPHKHIAHTYFARAKHDRFTLSEEHREMKWVSQEELDSGQLGMNEVMVFYCREAIKLAQ